jgi:4-amino-4-deoxy-L-arabinose transferase-like glycosyltransferase
MRSAPRTSLHTLLQRIPAAAWICALVALLNGAAWSLITPPFQGRDEPSHFAYVQQLVETGTLPHEVSEGGGFSARENRAIEGLHQFEIQLAPEVPAISSVSEQRALAADLSEELSPVGSGDAGVATSEPPLYYAVETVPYALGAGNILAQLQLMRLVGAVLAGLTTLLVFFFLREILPSSPWITTIATGCIAVQPLFGFMSGTLNPDTMLYTASAAVLLCLARAFRRGLSLRLAIALGVVTALGLVTKLNFIGLGAGIFLGLSSIGVREVRSHGREALKPIATAAGIGLSPVVLYAAMDLFSGGGTLFSSVGNVVTFSNGGFFKEVSYVWQLYLPPLPGMSHYFSGIETFREIWFDRFVGLYGWLDTQFPTWVDNLALIPAGLIATLCLRALIVDRKKLRPRLPEFATYALLVVGLLVMIGHSAFSTYISSGAAAFGDPRYLLPVLPLLSAILVLAIRGAGRWAPPVAAVVLVTFLAHDLFSQMQTISRYYG